MSRNEFRKPKQAWPAMLAATGLALATLPAIAQHATSGHATAGSVTTARPMPGHSFPTPMRTTPMRSAPISSGQRFGGVRANSFGTSSAPPPSWELPKYVTPHWEIGPNVPIQPNSVQGNRFPRHGQQFGVGYVGFPYYVNPMAFGNAWDWNADSDSGEQAIALEAPARPEYAPQQPAPYAEAPEDQGYPAPPPPGYNQEGFPMPPQNNNAAESTAAQSDGLDHPPITLVFNNGRPPEKVSSYVLTGSSIFVAEPGHQRKIPIADLDLPATIEQNREAGVDFELPGGRR
jgi:hypothetical protein